MTVVSSAEERHIDASSYQKAQRTKHEAERERGGPLHELSDPKTFAALYYLPLAARSSGQGSPIRKLNRRFKISDWIIKTFHT